MNHHRGGLQVVPEVPGGCCHTQQAVNNLVGTLLLPGQQNKKKIMQGSHTVAHRPNALVNRLSTELSEGASLTLFSSLGSF